MKYNLSSFFVGFLFAFGLILGGMTDTSNVIGFLDITGEWKLELMGVMIGAIGVHAIAFQFIKHKSSPLLATEFHLPTKKEIDKKLILGSALFGIGWAIAGVCPGPAIVSLASFNPNFYYFVVSMIVGMKIYHFVEKKIK